MVCFQDIVNSICEDRAAHKPWALNQLAFRVLQSGNPNNASAIALALKHASRYWTSARPGLLVVFRWNCIEQDGLLPPARDAHFIRIAHSVAAVFGPDARLTYPELAETTYRKAGEKGLQRVAHAISSHALYTRVHPGQKIEFLWERIKKGPVPPRLASLQPQDLPALRQWLDRALEDELKSLVKSQRKSVRAVPAMLCLKGSALNGYCYAGRMTSLGRGEAAPPLLDGMGVQVTSPSLPGRVAATLLSCDELSGDVIIEFEKHPGPGQLIDVAIEPDAARLIKGFRKFLPFIEFQKAGLIRHLLVKTQPFVRVPNKPTDGNVALDSDQRAFLEAARRNRVTLLWGPPGTGKTHTLAEHVCQLTARGYRVLCVSIANKAIDELARKCAEKLMGQQSPLLSEGRVLRLGQASSDLVRYPELFAHRKRTSRLLRILARIRARRKRAGLPAPTRALLTQRERKIHDHLKDVVRLFLSRASLVFTTIAQLTTLSEFAPGAASKRKLSKRFDVVVCDEASMMNVSHAIPPAYWASRCFILAGDWKQLGPVVLAQSKAALEVLHPSVFHLEDLEQVKNSLDEGATLPATARIVALWKQRRMSPAIGRMVSNASYHGKLQNHPVVNQANPWHPPRAPSGHFPMVLCAVRGGVTQMTALQSRRNPNNAIAIKSLVYSIASTAAGSSGNGLRSIGIIAPYRAQVPETLGILNLAADGVLPGNPGVRVRVGTIHAFQGSEEDVILWDLVDSRDCVSPEGTPIQGKPGLLFRGATGERLATVAASRAKSALYIVGDIDLFLQKPPNDVLARLMWEIQRNSVIVEL